MSTQQGQEPAFPCDEKDRYGHLVQQFPGMSLRAYLAGQALVGMGMWMPDDSRFVPATDFQAMSKRAAYAVGQADALLAALDKGKAATTALPPGAVPDFGVELKCFLSEGRMVCDAAETKAAMREVARQVQAAALLDGAAHALWREAGGWGRASLWADAAPEVRSRFIERARGILLPSEDAG